MSVGLHSASSSSSNSVTSTIRYPCLLYVLDLDRGEVLDLLRVVSALDRECGEEREKEGFSSVWAVSMLVELVVGEVVVLVSPVGDTNRAQFVVLEAVC